MKKEQAVWITWIALVLFLMQPVRAVQAHANLIRSNPAPGAALKLFPTMVQMEFTEAIAPSSVRVQLLDAANQLIAIGKPSLSPANPTVLTVSLPAQPDGIYHLNWQVQSAVDDHLTNGSIAFSVGVNTPPVSLLPPPGSIDPAAALPSWIEVLLRSLGYLSISLLVGGALFDLLVWSPAILKEASAQPDWQGYYQRTIAILLAIGVVTGVISVLGLSEWQQYLIGGLTSLHQHAPSSSPSLFDRETWSQPLQYLAIFGFLFLMEIYYSKPIPRPRGNLWFGVSLAFAGGLLWVHAAGSHNAAIGGLLPILIDFLHLLAMSAWLGGLLPLAFLLVHEQQVQQQGTLPLITQLAKRFSRLAFIAVIALGVSGLYSALAQVKTWEALLDTRYGQVLLIKTGLFGLLVALGAVNQKKILPAMERVGRGAAAWLGRTVRVEYGLALLLLLVIGVLMSLSPAYQALQAQRQMGFHEHYQEGAVQMDLRVAPAQVGENEYGVDIIDRRPGANRVAATVLIRFQMVEEDMGTTQVEAKEASPNRYTVRGSYLSMLGTWRVDVILRKAGFDDVRHTFIIDLEKLIGN